MKDEGWGESFMKIYYDEWKLSVVEKYDVDKIAIKWTEGMIFVHIVTNCNNDESIR